MPKQFAFNQMFGQGTAVHRDERHVRTWTQVMDPPGNQFFTRSRFTLNQNTGIGWSDLFAQFFDAKHWWRMTNQVRRTLNCLKTAFQCDCLICQCPFLGNAFERGRNFRHFPRLAEKVVSPGSNALNGGIHVSMAGTDNDFGFRRDFSDVVDHVPAA